MREFLFWAFVLTALPGCSSVLGIEDWEPRGDTPDPGFNLVKGSLPRDAVVFCDIVKTRRCATTDDIENGIPLTEAAVALNSGDPRTIALDYSPEKMANCLAETGESVPEAIEFFDKFPEGTAVCLNCGEVLGPGKANLDAAAVCRAACYDMFLAPPNGEGDVLPVKPPTQATIDYCAVNASVSTNMTLDACIAGACDNGGTYNLAFDDPRRVSEPVVWTDFIPTGGVAPGGAEGNDLIRTTNAPAAWNVGAVSEQLIRKGDAFVTFSAGPGLGVLVGFSEVPNTCPGQPECHDSDASDTSVKFGIELRDGLAFVSEGGVEPNLGGPAGSLGLTTAGDRFRVYVHDEGNGTASVRYLKLPPGGCMAGSPCLVVPFYTSTGVATYPLRVDSSLFHEGATATNVRLMRNKAK